MAYINPKTDWAIKVINGVYTGDFLNVSDYERIIGNIDYIAKLMQTIYGTVVSLNPMPDKAVNAIPYASDFNAIEDNIDILCQNLTMPSTWTGKKTWYANKPTPTVGDWNRWEQTILELKNRIDLDAVWEEFYTKDNEPFYGSDGQFMVLEGV